jgi:hypothetical protein
VEEDECVVCAVGFEFDDKDNKMVDVRIDTDVDVGVEGYV